MNEVDLKNLTRWIMRNIEVFVWKSIAVDWDLAAPVALGNVAALEDEAGQNPMESGSAVADAVIT